MTSVSNPFVGRVAELAALEEALAAAILGRGSAVLLAGEPGIGKTRLASELCDRAQRRGGRVLWARCATDAQAPPYWPFAQLLRPLYSAESVEELVRRYGPGARDVVALFGPGEDEAAGEPATAPKRAKRGALLYDAGASAATDQQRFRLFDTVTAMLLDAAGTRPLVLVFDDIHAADPGCLQLLLFLVRALRSSPALVVATLRSAESKRPEVAPLLLGTLAREALTLAVDGWTREEVGAFLSRASGSPGGEDAEGLVDSVHRASAGNPFFVGEIARLLRPGDAHASGASFPVPAHVRQAVLARLEALDAATRAVLEAAAIAGLSFDAATVSAVAGVDAGEVTRALVDAAEAGFVERAGEVAWGFRHEIAREVMHESLDGDFRRRGHLAAAAALARGGRNQEAVADHLLRALPAGDLDKAVAQALAAADAAVLSLAYERAAGWLRRALAALEQQQPPDDDSAAGRARLRGRLLLSLGDALWAAGDLGGSRAAFEDAAALAEASDPVDAVLLARAALGLGGRQQRAHVQFDARVVVLLERALAVLAATPSGASTADAALLGARLQARLAYALYAAPGSRAERERLSAAALELARKGGDARTLRSVLADRRWALWGPATLDERRAIGEELVLAAQRAADREALLVETGWRLVDALELGDRGSLDEAFAAYRGRAAELKLPWYDWYLARFACLLAQVEGRLDDAEKLAAEALAAGERAGHPDAPLAFGSEILGIRLAQDRAAELEGAVEMSVAQYPDVLLWRRLLARVRVAQGRQAEASGEIERARRGELLEAPGDFLELPSLAILAELAAETRDAEVCRRVFEALARYGGRQVVLGFGMAFLGPVDLYLGELATALGELEEARRRLDAALEQCARLGAQRWSARARTTLKLLQQVSAQAGSARAAAPPGARDGKNGALRAVLEADGAGWRGEFGGAAFRLGALRGIVYLRALLEVPDRELHVLELAALGDPDGARKDRSGGTAIADRADRSDAGPMLDDRAKRAYRTRLAELKAELDEASDFADSGRMTVARAEIEALEDELARAIGLGGRDRKSGAAAERARVAVAKRIRGALERIGEQSPELQRYLEATIRTGVFCVYRPDPGRPVSWEL